MQCTPPDYLAAQDEGVEGLRIAWTDDYGYSRTQWQAESEEVVALGREAAFGLAAAGANVAKIHDEWEDVRPTLFALLAATSKFAHTPPADMDEVNERIRRADEAVGWESDVPSTNVVPETSTEDYRTVSEHRRTAWETLRRVLDDYDMIASVTTPLLPRTIAEWGLTGREMLWEAQSAHTAMYNLLGYPAVSVPCGLLNGLPVGIQLAGKTGSEALLLRAAATIQARNGMPERPTAIK